MAEDDVRYANVQNIYEVLSRIETQMKRIGDLFESAMADYQPPTTSATTQPKKRSIRTTEVGDAMRPRKSSSSARPRDRCSPWARSEVMTRLTALADSE
jgi:hypothetical protein